MSKYNCCVCGVRRVPLTAGLCVPEVCDPGRPDMPLGGDGYLTGTSPDADDVCLCPGCAGSNPDETLNCSECGRGIGILTGYNPFVSRHVG
jgi:hypothetical protein